MIEKLFFDSEQQNEDEQSNFAIEEKCKKIRISWEDAAFSCTLNQTLVRYFHIHLEGISKFSDTLFSLTGHSSIDVRQQALLGLIDHLKIFYTPYFNVEAFVPVIYHSRFCNKIIGKCELFIDKLQGSAIGGSLKALLTSWIELMLKNEKHVRFSFKSLFYFELLVQQLSYIDFQRLTAEEQVITCLTNFNFNHLAFFNYRCRIIREESLNLKLATERLTYLQNQKAITLSSPEVINAQYDPNWPSVKVLMTGWLSEEIHLIEIALKIYTDTSQKKPVQKLLLNIPVAYLAYLIRLFNEESVIDTTNLSTTFKFFTDHFQSKRQAVISPGSLSKEYYSTDQQTAARVKDILQRMILRINRNFFPVVVAISTGIYAFLGMN